MKGLIASFRERDTTSPRGETERGADPTQAGISPESADQRAGLKMGIVVVVVTLIVSMAAVFGSSRSAVQISELGTRGIYDEAALSAAATTRNRAVQAYLIDSASALGVSNDDELAAAIEAADLGIDELMVRVERLGTLLVEQRDLTRVQEANATFVADLDGLLAALEVDGEAPQELLAKVDAGYQELAGLLIADRDSVVTDLALARQEAGRIANAARFLVAFAVPLGAVFAFRRGIRRRQRQIELEQELARQRQVAQAKDHFIADLSHELRTPLTSIYGFASTLQDEKVAADIGLTTEFASLIATEADELGRMIDDLLAAARAEDDALTFRREKVDPRAEVEAVLAPLRAMGFDIASRVAPDLVSADRLRLRQVLRNLLSNATKHGAPPVAVTGHVERLRYVLAITDSGPGVPPELERRLFERFIHQGRDPLLTGSVGLGLSIAQLLVRRMGGNLIYRRSDALTTFQVELPLWVDLDETTIDSHDRERVGVD